MKVINLKVVPMLHSSLPSDFILNYKNEYLRLLDVVPEGVTVVELADLVAVINKLKASNDEDTLKLQESEWNALKKRVESTKFNLIAPEILQMCQAVINATDE